MWHLQPNSGQDVGHEMSIWKNLKKRLQVNNYTHGDVGGILRQRNSICVGNCINLDAFTVELTAKIRN